MAPSATTMSRARKRPGRGKHRGGRAGGEPADPVPPDDVAAPPSPERKTMTRVKKPGRESLYDYLKLAALLLMITVSDYCWSWSVSSSPRVVCLSPLSRSLVPLSITSTTCVCLSRCQRKRKRWGALRPRLTPLLDPRHLDRTSPPPNLHPGPTS